MASPRSLLRHPLAAGAWPIAALLLVVLLNPVTRALDVRTFDWRLGLRADSGWPDDLVLVPIDDASQQVHGRWPWPRRDQAKLVDALEELGAKTILYDLIPYSPSEDPAGDEALAVALDRAVVPVGFTPKLDNAVVSPILQERAMIPVAPPEPRFSWKTDELLAPIPSVARRALGLGHPNFPSGADQVVRWHVPLFQVEGLEGSLPSISLVAWLKHRDLDPRDIRYERGQLVLPDGVRYTLNAGTMYIDYRPDATPPPIVSAREVLARDADRDALRKRLEGKLALVHLDSVISPDTVVTPLNHATPGGVVQAWVLRTFAAARAPRGGPDLAVLLTLVWALFVSAPRLGRMPPGRVLGGMGAATLLVAGVSMAIVPLTDVFLNFVNPVLLLLLSGAGLAVHSSMVTERERKRLQALLKASLGQARASAVLDEDVWPAQPDGGRVAGAVPGEPLSDDDVATTPVPVDLSKQPADKTLDFSAKDSTTGARAAAKPGGAAALLAGQKLAQPVELGRYIVERSLGRGGMGAIFLGRDRDLDRYVAIKVLEAADKGAYLRFRREALAVARIVHPNVVQIYEVGFDSEAPYIVMEFVPGGTVADMLRDPSQPYPPDWVRSTKIIRGIARGLSAAHVAGIVHRDVKPSNLLLTEHDADDGKIADFGIAKLSDTQSLTSEGSFVGTVGYLSPEQALGTSVDARSDVYSLGVTWYRMVTGRPAFEGTTAQILRASVQKPIGDPRRLNKEFPDAFAKLLGEMTDLDRGKRPKDCTAVAARIDDLLRDYTAS